MKDKDPGLTNNQGREALGVGGCINTCHGGPTKNPTESAAERSINNKPVSKKVKRIFKGTRLTQSGKIETYEYEVEVEE